MVIPSWPVLTQAGFLSLQRLTVPKARFASLPWLSFSEAGITVVKSPAEIGDAMAKVLGKA